MQRERDQLLAAKAPPARVTYLTSAKITLR